jgi:hypothetical protein
MTRALVTEQAAAGLAFYWTAFNVAERRGRPARVVTLLEAMHSIQRVRAVLAAEGMVAA